MPENGSRPPKPKPKPEGVGTDSDFRHGVGEEEGGGNFLACRYILADSGIGHSRRTIRAVSSVVPVEGSR
ncbi:hypothetical protein, partial [Streptomyces scabiei]|uniref:hypothetical protein n=1 Tax=Streptomyces scabiei TaxID=1930 RepID=UPI0029A398BC